jgi:Amt family ammonium transporter
VLAVVGTLVIAGILKLTMGLRVSAEEEVAGLDLTEHGESGYAGPSYGSESTAPLESTAAVFKAAPEGNAV